MKGVRKLEEVQVLAETFTFTLNREEAEYLWHRLNLSDTVFAEVYFETDACSTTVAKPKGDIHTLSHGMWQAVDNVVVREPRRAGK